MPWSSPDGTIVGNNPIIFKYEEVKKIIEERIKLTPPIDISMTAACPSTSGNATITIKNTSESNVSGTLQVVLKESKIDHAWEHLKTVEFCSRKMLPNEKGEEVTVSPGQSITKKRTFTLQSGWVKKNCSLMAFLQQSDKKIMNGCSFKLDATAIAENVLLNKRHPLMTIKHNNSLIYFKLPESGIYSLSIYTTKGRLIQNLRNIDTSKIVNIKNTFHSGLAIVCIKGKNVTMYKRMHIVQ